MRALSRTVSALVAAGPVPGVSTLCSTSALLIGVAPSATLGTVLRSTGPVALTPLRATDAAAVVDAVLCPAPPDCEPQAVRVVAPRARARTAAVRAAGRWGRTGVSSVRVWRSVTVPVGGAANPATVTPTPRRHPQRPDRSPCDRA